MIVFYKLLEVFIHGGGIPTESMKIEPYDKFS